MAIGCAYLALVAPSTYGNMHMTALLRIPFEFVALGWLLTALPRRFSRAIGVVIGALAGVLFILKLVDVAFDAAWSRPFNPVFDFALATGGFESLQASLGDKKAIAAVVIGALLGVAVIALIAASFVRIAKLTARHRKHSWRAMAALTVIWSLAMLLGAPRPLLNSAEFAYDKSALTLKSFSDKREFAGLMANDAYADTPGSRLLSSLRGKDVVVVFVESYGRSAVDDSPVASPVTNLLKQGSDRLASDGFAAKSGFLTSSVQGGGSWMAHATFSAGVWTDNQRRYDTLVASNRLTLEGAFKKAGWRTIAVSPGNNREWPESRFFGFDQAYNAQELAYLGPGIQGWFPIPDQYSLAKMNDILRAQPDDSAFMTEITLTSSHGPWAQTPPLLDWKDIDDGSVFNRYAEMMKADGPTWSDPPKVQAAYQNAIKYSLESIVSYVENFADDDQVFIILGDHQPASVVTGDNASKDVPISIVSRDAAVTARIEPWGWSNGLRPNNDAPVWPMDVFRDQFLRAFG